MKKLLGLLLNCVALCLCSAIGIGAGMYWMQQTQQQPASTPAIQQTGSFESAPLQQAPGLLEVPATSHSKRVAPIPTAVAPHLNAVRLLALESNKTEAVTDQSTVTLLVDNKPVGTLNPNTPNGTQSPAGKEFYLTSDELDKISFSAKTIKDTIEIKNVENEMGNNSQPQQITQKDTVTWKPSFPIMFSERKAMFKVTLKFVDISNPTNTLPDQDFTFKLFELPTFKTVSIQRKDNQGNLDLTESRPVSLNGPTEKLQIEINRVGTVQTIYRLKIKQPRADAYSDLSVDESLHSPDVDHYETTLETAGNYTLGLFEDGASVPYKTRSFSIRPAGTERPFISQLTDTGSTNKILYDRSILSIKQIPAYLLRNDQFTLTVPLLSGDRKLRVKYRKIVDPGQATEKKGDFKELRPATAPQYEFNNLSLSFGTYEIQAEDRWMGPLNPTQELNAQELTQVDRIRVIVLEPSGQFVLQPTIASSQNQKYPLNADANPISGQSPINLYGGYLQLNGSNGYPDYKPHFLLFNEVKNDDLTLIAPALPADVTVEKLEVTTTGNWSATLKLKKVNTDTDRVLYVRTINGVHHAYSAEPLILKSAQSSLETPLDLAQFEIINSDGNTTPLASDLVIYDHSPDLKIRCTTGDATKHLRFLIYSENQSGPIGEGVYDNGKTAKLNSDLPNGQHRFYLKFAQGDEISEQRSDSFIVKLQTQPLTVKDVQPPNFGTAAGVQQLKIKFSPDNPLKIDLAKQSEIADWFRLIPSRGTGVFGIGDSVPPNTSENKILYSKSENAVTLSYLDLPADIYQLEIVGSQVKDIYGNPLVGTSGQPGTNYAFALSKPEPVEKKETRSEPESMVSEFVEYREYETRKDLENGFNPSDKVVTRVARLYYYRDAHRVAQILNSEVQSLNHKGYHDAQILADEARSAYDTAVKKRRLQEEKAILASQELRQKEKDYRTQQQILSSLVRERANLEGQTSITDSEQLENRRNSLEQGITKAQSELTKLRSDMTSISAKMHEEDQKLKEQNLDEDNLSAELFRREVRAEKTDLYTIANGKPDSYDAVRQVTIKVIGEGMIHLRGPIKGVNIVRTMINQIDAPVGQVRISMHTIQVNGEDGKRMEDVADRIQKSVDQSRFLTVQSAQMLRKAIISVASEVSLSTCQEGAAFTQEQRDEKYLHAFFGQDFIEALREMNSEFLQTGNKLLSIHSMDTTSLSSALFVLALAKNDIRQQILARFFASIQVELPEAELQFLYQGGPTKVNNHKHLHLLGPYAYFQSFKGFFDHEIAGTDTMTPVQREFVRLAQIFKAKLITERELNLHVMERAMIEQRVGNYLEELQAAKDKEKLAEDALSKVQDSIQKSQIEVVKATTGLEGRVSEISNEFGSISNDFKSFESIIYELANNLLRAATCNTNFEIRNYETNKRQALLNDLFPIEKTTAKENEEIVNRIDFVIDKYKLQKCPIPSTSLRKNPLNPNKISKISFVPRSSHEIKMQQEIIKTQLDSRAQGTFTYGDTEFHFHFEDGKFHLDTGSAAFNVIDNTTTEYIYQCSEVIQKLDWFNQLPPMKQKISQAREILGLISLNNRDSIRDIHRVARSYLLIQEVTQHTANEARHVADDVQEINILLQKAGTDSSEIQKAISLWSQVRSTTFQLVQPGNSLYQEATELFTSVDKSFNNLIEAGLHLKFAQQNASNSRQELDHKKFLDMQIDQTEDKFIELVEGTRAHTANIDNYLKRIATALEDDFNTQFYYPAFKEAREASRYWNVSFGSMETSSILTNNRSLGKVAPKATIEFDLPKRQLAIIEGMNVAGAAFQEYGALVNDPTFLAITSMNGGENVQGGYTIQPDSLEKQVLGQPGSQGQKFGAAFENLIPDPAVFKFETGTGFTVRPVIQPDGQAVVFDLNYLYRTNVREPVRADEKHLGRIKEHFIDTDVQLGNYELREISRFVIALKASRTGNGVPLLSDVPGVGVLFRPTPSAESSLQQSQIMSQAVIYPTLFDLMGLRWAPAVADVGPLELTNREFISKGRDRFLQNRVYDYAGSKVDHFLEIPESERRSDLYRTQQTIPDVHPNGYMGPGLNLKRSTIQENYRPEQQNPAEQFVPESGRQQMFDTDRAIPVLPTVPRIPPASESEGPTSSNGIIRDSGLKPASWTPTSPAVMSTDPSGRRNSTFQIASPRRISKPLTQNTQPQTATPTPVVNTTQNNTQPDKPESPGFYKRSVSRFKTLFQND